jgi:hypothetical protein
MRRIEFPEQKKKKKVFNSISWPSLDDDVANDALQANGAAG